MNGPLVSVIIPTYNYAAYLHNAIDSVLDQTYPDYEIIVVDDGSQDHTAQVVTGYQHPRVHYIHQENRGLPAARNTGIRAARGSLLAFLDADDQFHPEKLECQVVYLQANPDIGLTYNGRFLVTPQDEILFMRHAPEEVGLADLVTDYPFSPSDVVVRREWAEKVDLYDESYRLNSEDLNFHLRLALAGCRFGGVDRVLTYRQLHPDRIFKNIPGKLETYLRALNTAFNHAACPPGVLALRDIAYANHYLTWAVQASIQDEHDLFQPYLRQALELNPRLLKASGKPLLNFFVHFVIRDGCEHEQRLKNIFTHLPDELSFLKDRLGWTTARGYLQRGIRDITWGRVAQGVERIHQAKQMGAHLDEDLLATLGERMTAYQREFGEQAAARVLSDVAKALRGVPGAVRLQQLEGLLNLNRAFQEYQRGLYRQVPARVMRAVLRDPSYLVNKGVLSIFARSLIGLFSSQGAAR